MAPLAKSDVVKFVDIVLLQSSPCLVAVAAAPSENKTAAVETACQAPKLARKTSACSLPPVTFELVTGFIRHWIGSAALDHFSWTI
jgi:hypothetical protein